MKKRKRRSDRSGGVPLRSPGRLPSAQREDHRRFWAAIATGQSSEDAASLGGVSPAGGGRRIREAGGMPPAKSASSAKLPSKRYLQFAEREEIARQLERAVSTISRELRRNAATRSGGLEYRATTAQWHADRSARRPKPAQAGQAGGQSAAGAPGRSRCGAQTDRQRRPRSDGGRPGALGTRHTLDGIARRLQSMGQGSLRGGLRWSRSSVKNLLDRTREQGLLREADAA